MGEDVIFCIDGRDHRWVEGECVDCQLIFDGWLNALEVFAGRYDWLRKHSFPRGLDSICLGYGCHQCEPEFLDKIIDEQMNLGLENHE